MEEQKLFVQYKMDKDSKAFEGRSSATNSLHPAAVSPTLFRSFFVLMIDLSMTATHIVHRLATTCFDITLARYITLLPSHRIIPSCRHTV